MSSFSFGFSSDDVDVEDVDGEDGIAANLAEVELTEREEPEKLIPPRRHELDELLQTLPSHLSYDILPLSPRPHTNTAHLKHLPRRSHFDILAQLKAEASPSSSPLIHALTTNDLRPTVYEGGLKTWECSLDLARYLISSEVFTNSNDDASQSWHIIELGAGSALPSLALFSFLLLAPPSPPLPPTSSEHPPASTAVPAPPRPNPRVHFTLADYNASVLSLSTLPNLILAWWEARGKHEYNATSTSTSPDPDPDPEPEIEQDELPLPPSLLSRFLASLTSHRISLSFLSGAWGPEFVSLLHHESKSTSTSPPSPLSPSSSLSLSKSEAPNANANVNVNTNLLVLAAETVYSPKSLPAFAETVLAAAALTTTTRTTSTPPCYPLAHGGGGGKSLKGKAKAQALVAAKQLYFGVGGGVEEFVDELLRARKRRVGRGDGDNGDKEKEVKVKVRTVWRSGSFSGDGDTEGEGDERDERERGEREGGGDGGGVGRVILEVQVSRD